MSRDDAFKNLRLAEAGDATELLRRHGKISGDLLEIGAGRGWQARALNDAGYRVEAIDLPAGSAISSHARERHWPIRDYDGVHIPYPDANFDIIYSSNVLEHVEQLDALMDEIKRVLRRDGLALHLVPNPQWRLLSLATYYPGQAIDLLRFIRRRRSRGGDGSAQSGRKPPSKLNRAMKRLLPPTHGAVGNPIGEVSRYSRRRWDHYFAQRGWQVVEYGNNGLLASGDYLMGSALEIDVRRKAGRLIGGIAHVYLLRPSGGNAAR